MKKVIFVCISLLTVLSVMIPEVRSEGLYEPTFKLEKVNGNVYVVKQGIPLEPILGTGPGTYLTVNFYVIASDDRSEVVLIDGPALPALMYLLSWQRFESEFPEARRSRGYPLDARPFWTIAGRIPYFASMGIPVYASTDENQRPFGACGT